MEFKKLKTDELALLASLISREAKDRSPALEQALRRVQIVADGRYGAGRPDVHLTIAVAASLEAIIVQRWYDRDATPSVLAEEVGKLVNCAERIFGDSENTIAMVREVRAALSREVSKARRRGLSYRTVDIYLTPVEAEMDDLPAVAIGLEALGPLLTALRVRFDAESADDVVQNFAEMRGKQEARHQMKERLAQTGGDVLIDAVTLKALMDSSIDPAQAIASLQEGRNFRVDVKHGRMVLYVRDGVVTGNVPLGDEMFWQEGKLTVPKERGLSIANAEGNPLSLLVQHEYLGSELIVAHVSEIGNRVSLSALSTPLALNLGQRKLAA